MNDKNVSNDVFPLAVRELSIVGATLSFLILLVIVVSKLRSRRQ